MSATGAAIQIRRIHPAWSTIVGLLIAVGIVGFVTGQITERNAQPAPAAVAEHVVPITNFTTESGAARTDVYRALGRLPSLRVDSPFRSETALTKVRMYEALGRLGVATDVGAATPDFRRGLGATKSG